MISQKKQLTSNSNIILSLKEVLPVRIFPVNSVQKLPKALMYGLLIADGDLVTFSPSQLQQNSVENAPGYGCDMLLYR